MNRTLLTLIFVVALCVVANPAAHAATFRVGTGAGCTHASVQAAIDAAEGTAETDFIRITRSTTYANQALRIDDQHLILQGGYANCQSTTQDNVRTILTGSGDESVLEISGEGDIVLSTLTITGGDPGGGQESYGGGIQIRGGPHLVSLSEVFVTNNEAGRGGGISVKNDESDDPTDVVLVLGHDTVVSNNHADFTPISSTSLIQGGGVYCRRSTLRLVGDNSAILQNTANHDGGGIGADRCVVDIAPSGLAFNGITLNQAGRDGGAIATDGLSYVNFYATNPARPVVLALNDAGREGGAIKMNGRTTVRAWDLIIEANRANDMGGGVSMYNDDDNDDAFFSMYGSLEGAPAGAVLCNPEKRCNRFEANVAMNEDDEPREGAAFRMATAGFFEHARGTVLFKGTKFERNRGKTLLDNHEDTLGGAVTRLAGVAMSGNDVSGTLIATTGDFDMWASTIAGNAIGGTNVIFTANDGSSTPALIRRSIVWQPGKTMLTRGFGGLLAAGEVTHCISNNFGPYVPAETTNLVADPQFVDVDGGDVHLMPYSPAVDFAPIGSTSGFGSDPEADGRPRVVDLSLVPNGDGFGPQDVGAYETQTIGNLIRHPDFADDVHAWTPLLPAAVWNNDDYGNVSSSGSAQFEDGSMALSVAGFLQCVPVPGPATYSLGGFGWISDTNVIFADKAKLMWELRRNDADCNATTPIAFGEETVSDGGWHAFFDQRINVPVADWGPNTRIAVYLAVGKTLNPALPTYFARARLDGITLTQAGTDYMLVDSFETTP
jgi:hypothetical protein